MINLELSSLHKSIGGKMVDYAGFNMAVQYEGVISEHLAVRNHVGVFDVSHMGEIFISGNEAVGSQFDGNVTEEYDKGFVY